jgi:hypothetical protein
MMGLSSRKALALVRDLKEMPDTGGAGSGMTQIREPTLAGSVRY